MIKFIIAFILLFTVSYIAPCIAPFFSLSQINTQSTYLQENTKDATQKFEGIAVRVKDGDTLVFREKNGYKYNVRLYGIDTPEKSQPYGPQATGILKELVNNKNLVLRVYGEDRYKRKLAKVYVDGRDINATLLAKGAAWHYKKYDKSSDYSSYASLEAKAKHEKKGLWNKDKPIPPWKYRQSKKKKQ